jgi:hypothetical protein
VCWAEEDIKKGKTDRMRAEEEKETREKEAGKIFRKERGDKEW